MTLKYQAWDREFQRRTEAGDREISLTIAELEDLIDDELPPSAREYQAWWSGDRSQTPWTKYGWRASPRLPDRVEFRLLDVPKPVAAARPTQARSSPTRNAVESERDKRRGPQEPTMDVDQLNRTRRWIRRICDHVDPQRQSDEGQARRLGRLMDDEVIPPVVGSFMRCLTILRNRAEYSDIKLSPSESIAARAMWDAVVNWAVQQGWKSETQ